MNIEIRDSSNIVKILSDLYKNYKSNIIILMNTDDDSSKKLIKSELEEAQNKLCSLLQSEMIEIGRIIKSAYFVIENSDKDSVIIIDKYKIEEFINHHLSLELDADYSYERLIINENLLNMIISSSNLKVTTSIYSEDNLDKYIHDVLKNVEELLVHTCEKIKELIHSIDSMNENRIEAGVLGMKTLTFIFNEYGYFYKSATAILSKIIID